MQSAGLRAALEDVRAACGPGAGAWVDQPEAFGSRGPITVYVLDGGVLHRVRGERDVVPDGSDPEARTVTTVEYTIERVTGGASYALLVSTEIGPRMMNASPYGSVRQTLRRWQFRGLGRFDSLELVTPRHDGLSHRPDPTAFARALMSEILRLKGGRESSGSV